MRMVIRARTTPHAVESEAEELAFMRRVRAVRRVERTQRKVGHGVERPREGSAPEPFADLPTLIKAQLRDIRTAIQPHASVVGWEDFHETYPGINMKSEEVNRDFVAWMGWKALDYQHKLFANIFTYPMLADGSENREATPTIVNVELLTSLPDTDGQGDPIHWHDFTWRWNSRSDMLLRHLLRKHEGEVAEAWGVWKPWYGRVPMDGSLYHPQFAWDEAHFIELKRKAKGKGKGKGKKGGKRGPQPADGGKSQPMAAQTPQGTRVLSFDAEHLPPGYHFAYRTGGVFTLAMLFYYCGSDFCATDLYRFYCRCRLMCVRRAHSWASYERQAAARMRYTATGRWGFGQQHPKPTTANGVSVSSMSTSEAIRE